MQLDPIPGRGGACPPHLLPYRQMRFGMICYLPLAVSVFTGYEVVREIYEEVGAFRSSPVQYCLDRGWNIACSIDVSTPRGPVRVMGELEQASGFQASTLASDECPDISHTTCPAYCHLFGDSCSYDDRIGSFMGDPFDTIREVLLKGAWRPQRIMMFIAESEGHCNDLLDPDVNAMGGTMIHNAKTLFVLTMVRCEWQKV